MGGSDPGDHTGDLISLALSSSRVTNLIVVLGAHYAHSDKLIEKFRSEKIDLKRNLSASELRDVMEQCPLAILPPSTMAMEYASVGGGLFLKQTADNQEGFYRFFTGEGLAADVSTWRSHESPGGFETFIPQCEGNQKKYFDGRSGARLLKEFRSLYWNRSLRLRNAASEDSSLLFNWANDPQTRQNAFSTAAIPWETHQRWFQSKLASGETKIFIAGVDEIPMAQIRFELEGNGSWKISFSIDPAWRGRGLAAHILKIGVKSMRALGKTGPFFGEVKPDNVPSWRAFETAGFTKLVASTETRVVYQMV